MNPPSSASHGIPVASDATHKLCLYSKFLNSEGVFSQTIFEGCAFHTQETVEESKKRFLEKGLMDLHQELTTYYENSPKLEQIRKEIVAHENAKATGHDASCYSIYGVTPHSALLSTTLQYFRHTRKATKEYGERVVSDITTHMNFSTDDYQRIRHQFGDGYVTEKKDGTVKITQYYWIVIEDISSTTIPKIGVTEYDGVPIVRNKSTHGLPENSDFKYKVCLYNRFRDSGGISNGTFFEGCVFCRTMEEVEAIQKKFMEKMIIDIHPKIGQCISSRKKNSLEKFIARVDDQVYKMYGERAVSDTMITMNFLTHRRNDMFGGCLATSVDSLCGIRGRYKHVTYRFLRVEDYSTTTGPGLASTKPVGLRDVFNGRQIITSRGF